MPESQRATLIRARLDAPAHVELMLEVLASRSGVALETIRLDPLGWLDDWDELDLVDLGPSQATADDRCSIDGLYRDDPPCIGVAFSDTRARMNFSALHELGHHIQMTDEGLADALAERSDGGEALEEVACDRFAAALLIPDSAALRFLPTSGVPRADEVADLWRDLGSVSRSAVAIRAVRDAPTDTLVLVVDNSGTVTFAAGSTPVRPPRGTDQTSTEIWNAITRMGNGKTAHARTQLGYSIGLAGDRYYAQAARMGAGYVVVAATDHVPWLSLSVAHREYVPVGRSAICLHPACAFEFRTAEQPHELCGAPSCPACGRCGCGLVARNEFTCTNCFELKGGALMSSSPNICVDCI